VSSRPDHTLPDEHALRRFLDEWAPKAMWVGVLGALITLGYLVWAAVQVASQGAAAWGPDDVKRIDAALQLAGKGFFASALVLSISVVLQWFDEVSIGPVLLVVAAAIFWGIPMLVFMMNEGHSVANQHIFNLALAQIRIGAIAFVAPGLVALVYVAATHTYTSGTVGLKK
jgi:hypothetical protein